MSAGEQAPGALEGVRVVEIAQVLALPMCGLLLADMGADVIKVEPPAGDSFRYSQQPVLPGEGKAFIAVNRGKRSLCLDVTTAAARPVLQRLTAWADVVIISMKPSDLPRYHLAYEDFRAWNDRLIFLEHVPVGLKGPMGGDGGYDVVVQGLSGLGAITARSQGDAPANIRPAYSDMGTGFLSAFAICAALYEREHSGKGQRIETSILGTSIAMGAAMLHWFAATDPDTESAWREETARARQTGAGFEQQKAIYDKYWWRGAHGNIYFRHYRTADGFISIGCLSAATNARFRAVTGVKDPRGQPDFDLGTPEAFDVLTKLVRECEDLLRARTTAEWIEAFRAGGVPCGPFNFPPDVFHDPQVVANGYTAELEHPLLGTYRTFGLPVRMDRTPTRIRRSSPLLGEHTGSILESLGFGAEEVAGLAREGVIRQ